MTTTALLTPSRTTPRPAGAGRTYGRFWRRMPREVGYLAVTAVLGLVSLTVFRGVLDAGSSLLAVLLGVVVVAFLLLGCRYLATFELYRLRLAGQKPIQAPRWERPFAGKTFFRALGDIFANPHYWLAYVHAGVLNPVLAVLTGGVWVSWLLLGLMFATTPISLSIPLSSTPDHVLGGATGGLTVDGHSIGELLSYLFSQGATTANGGWVIAGFTALGLGLLAAFPFVTRGLTLTHWGLARLLLARFRSEDLGAEVQRVGVAQRAAIAAEDNALRRLERDIHDGPQQRLLRLQMELASAERHLPADAAGADGAAEAIAEARVLAQEALDELRALAQGFAPPLLQDRGLQAALEALARRSGVPIDLSLRLDTEVPAPIERSAYFIAAELTSNAIKHAAARRIALRVATEPPEAAPGSGALVLTVTDDGVGGAHLVAQHGLAGATERLTGLGGTLRVESPAGGPTEVTAVIPLPAA